MTFTETDKLKALAIVNIFETSRVCGDYAAVAVLNDGAGISYGISQFTHRSGALAEVLETYLAFGASLGRRVIEQNLKLARTQTPRAIAKLALDEVFKKALKAAAITNEMKAAQRQVAFARYLQPAIDACARFGFTTPLSLAVIYDSITHGSWEKIRDRVMLVESARASHSMRAGSPRSDEKDWITAYVRKRDAWLVSIPRLTATRYRTRFFLNQIAISNWDLTLPVKVHGVRLSTTNLSLSDTNSAVEPVPPTSKNLPNCGQGCPRSTPSQTIPSDPHSQAQPPDLRGENLPPRPSATPPNQGGEFKENCLDRIQEKVDHAAAKYDQVEEIVDTIVTRKDAAKSLWTTIVGTVTQVSWALFGLLAGVPREVWFGVAIIAAALMLLYLYRQIALGKIRERNDSELIASRSGQNHSVPNPKY